MRDAVGATGRKLEPMYEMDAAKLGCLSTLRQLERRGFLSRQEVLCEAAAKTGQLEELKRLRADGTPWDKATCIAASGGGHLGVLKWARANGCPWDANACACAARGGQLETLKWLHENDCHMDEWTCSNAAEQGHLEVLKWARENGCPYDGKTVVMPEAEHACSFHGF